MNRLSGLLLTLAVLALPGSTPAADWPTYRGDLGRRGVSAESLEPGKLRQAWQYRALQLPRPAWPGPARWDAYNRVPDLRSLRNYDPVYHVVAVGDAIFFGSSADDSVCCLDASTGKERWCFISGGPVRIAPTLHDGKVYFGSDDGCAYCLDARDGKPLWKVRAAPEMGMVLHQQRAISFWPVRTGVIVQEGTAYFGASLLPWKKSYLCAVDAGTGKVEGQGRYVKALDQFTLEGAMLASARGLVAPQGRTEPLLFDRTTGNPIGKLQGSMGCFVLLTEDEMVLQGPGNRKGEISVSNPATRTKVAAFPRANSAVVRGELACLVDDDAIFAINRKTGARLWRRNRQQVFEVLLAGDTLFVGGRDEVLALGIKDGAVLWTGAVQGRAYGLALANGRLLVSTDEGCVHCFHPAANAAGSPKQGDPAALAAGSPVPPLRSIADVKDPQLLGRWVFQKPHVQTLAEVKDKVQGTVADLAGPSPGKILGPIDLVRAGQVQALSFDGGVAGVELERDFKKAKLPKEAFTATAWVRIDQAQPWGGILGAMQDNGAFERGFILGYKGDHFCLGVAAEDGKNVMTYMTAAKPFELGRWYHVAGSYDGQEMRLYVDGLLSTTSKLQKGPIRWPARAFYYLGAYKDDDEHFPLLGQVHEVRLYDRSISADEVQKQHFELKAALPAPVSAVKAQPLPLLLGPMLQFVDSSRAVVTWESKEPTSLEFVEGKEPLPLKVERAAGIVHQGAVSGLRRNRLYQYRIVQQSKDGLLATEWFECDTNLNFAPTAHFGQEPWTPDAEQEKARATAARLLVAADADRGMAVVVGLRDARLTWELARAGKGRLHVIGVDDDRNRVEQLRMRFRAAGLYGSVVSLIHVEKLSDLPLPPAFANLVTTERPINPSLPVAALARVLRPGSVLVFDSPPEPAELQKRLGEELKLQSKGAPGSQVAFARRPALPGSANWSHQYGRPDNAAFTGETLGEARSTSDLEVLWLGDPGPRFQGDRNPRKPAPLSVNGRLFVQGFGRFLAMDAHNGSILWSLDIPRAARFNVLRDCSNWCADERHVYVAVEGACWQLDAATGERKQMRRLADVLGPEAGSRDWGQVVRIDDLLLGSSVKSESNYRGWWGKEHWYDAKAGALNHLVCSDKLFAMSLKGQQPAWTHRGGAILNPSITVADGRVFFVESRNPALKEKSGRLGDELWKDLHLVALDLTTGKEVWSRPISPLPGQAAFYLALGGGKLVLVSSEKGRYGVYTFDPRGGAPLWDKTFKWVADHHGAHLSRPAILGSALFLKPWVLDLSTGDKKPQLFPKGHGCGSYVVTEKMVVCRAGELTAWDWEKNSATRWSRLRPDCWISTIPAGGMLLSPEGGGGCSCGGWLDVSLGFLPRKLWP